MKKNFNLHEIIKDAVKEAILEVMYGVATVEGDTDDSAPEDGDGNTGEGNNNNNSGNNGSGNNGSGNNGGPIEPEPIWGPVGISE